MGTPHVHAEWIKAAADGHQVQRFALSEFWYDVTLSQLINEGYKDSDKFRIKPEPKPDVVQHFDINPNSLRFIGGMDGANLRLTFDGETGKLKAAEVL